MQIEMGGIMKNLTTDELVTALRNDQTCDDCIWAAEFNNDTRLLYAAAADMLENHASDRAAMVAEIEKLRKQLEQTHADRDAAIAGQETLQKAMAECKAERDVLRNELCYLCGKYRDAHNGACDGCRWKEAQ